MLPKPNTQIASISPGLKMEFKQSRKKSILIFFGCSAFVLACVLMLQFPGNHRSWYSAIERTIAACVGIVFFGLGTILSIWQIMYPKLLRFNQYGISYRPLREYFIPWSEISGIRVSLYHGAEFVCLKLKHIEKYDLGPKFFVSLSLQSGVIRSDEFPIDLGHLDIKAEMFIALAEQYGRVSKYN
jgi:hypothetical protein